MGKSLLSGVSMSVVLLVAVASRSDSGPPSTSNRPSLPAAAAEEPITGTPAVSRPGNETRRHDPFTPYDIGPPGTKAWTYNDLSPAEKAYVDRNRDVTGGKKTQDAFASAVKERAQHAAGAAAAHQLGVDDLSETGVVP